MEPYLKPSTVLRALESRDPADRYAAVLACRPLRLDRRELKRLAESHDETKLAAALYAYGAKAPHGLVEQAFKTYNPIAHRAAITAMHRQGPQETWWLPKLLSHADDQAATDEVVEMFRGRKIPIEEIEALRLLKSWQYHYFVVKAAAWDPDIPMCYLWNELENNPRQDLVQQAIAESMRVRGVTDDEIREMYELLKSINPKRTHPYWQSFMFTLQHRPGLVDVFETELYHCVDNTQVILSAEGLEIDLETILGWIHSGDRGFEAAGLYAAVGRNDVPAGEIEPFLKRFEPLRDPYADLRIDPCYAARKAAYRRPDISPVCTRELLGRTVYQYCLGQVRVIAEVPPFATVRTTSAPDTVRVDEVDVVKIVGDFYGEKIGLPYYTPDRPYRLGQRAEAVDFSHDDDFDRHGLSFYLEPVFSLKSSA